jgi:flagellin
MISINTNSASTAAAYNLSNTNANLQKSLSRLSSGSRIVNSVDDAGGLAVSMKLSAAIRRTDATAANVGNTLSFLQTQDGVLKVADKILGRMSELATLALDVTKSSGTAGDLALYQTEINSLKTQLGGLISQQFNGVALFGGTSTTTGVLGTNATIAVYTSEDAQQSVAVSQLNLGYLTGDGGVGTVPSTIATNGINVTDNTLAATAVSKLNTAIQNLATLRATNGSEQSRLTFAADMLAVNKQNLEAANGRIVDVDVAKESAQLARFNILQQAGTAMLAQANQSTQSVLRLLV